MKPISLTIKAFGPFADEVHIDFTKFENEGLFLIRGETGSGKTSILDAMTFALFGSVPGLRGNPVNKGEASVRLKSDYADEDTKPEVTFVVDIDGQRYKFKRTAAFLKEGNKNETPETAKLSRFENGEWVALETNVKAVGEQASSYIGMSKDQFTQLILLPQGGFAKFLTANNDDRRKVLAKLFPVDGYMAMQEWFKAQRELAKQRADQQKYATNALKIRFDQIVGQQDEEQDFSQDVIDGAVTAFHSALDELLETQNILDARWTELNDRVQRGVQGKEAAAKLLKAQEELNAAVAALSNAQNEALELGITDPSLAALGARTAELQRDVQDLEKKLEKLEGVSRRVATISDLQELLEKLGAESETLTANIADIEKQSGELKITLRETELKIAGSAAIQMRISAAKTGVEYFDKATKLAAKLAEASQAVDTALQAATAAEAELTAAENVYNQDLAAYLAHSLVDGESCLVCGSAEHPAPAQPAEGVPSRDKIDALRVTASERSAAHTRAVTQLDNAKSALAEHSEISCEFDSRDSAVDSLSAAQAELDALQDLEAQVANHTKQLDNFSQQLEKQKSQLQAKTSAFAEATQKLTIADTELKSLQTEVQGLDHQVIADRLENISAQQQKLEDISAVLANATQQKTQAEATIEANREAAQQELPDIDLLISELNELSTVRESNLQRIGLIKDKLKELEKVRTEFGPNAELVAAADAEYKQWQDLESYTSGNVAPRVDLATYYLGYRLKQVAAAASIRFQTASSGRYTFEHDETIRAARGNAGGLSIMIRDHWNGEVRGPESLSGGESFMASLSLALGLSDVVQAEAGGRQLQSLFVDEGFGSLDSGTLEEVMSVLDELRSYGRLVGVVSHVESMIERIPAQLIVKKTKTGSTISFQGI